MSVRAGIVVTGTEVLSGWVADKNGPWVAARLLDLGVDVAHITLCGDRPADLTAQLRFLADQKVNLIVTTGGLGPTADDLTVATVADFTGRPLHADADLEEQIGERVRSWRLRTGATDDPAAMAAGIHKQALIPEGAQPIPPVGTAPGLAIPATSGPGGFPAILILPGPPSELQGMWPAALTPTAIVNALSGRSVFELETIRAYGLREAELATTLRRAEGEVDGFDDLEITTCMRGGEVEIVTRFESTAAPAYAQLSQVLRDVHSHQIFSTDGTTLDDLIAEALRGRQVATAESCTGGLVAARLTDRAGSSAYVLGGVVSYANEVKSCALDVPAEIITEFGAVSEQVAAAMAQGALQRLDADTAISTTGIAGPDGGSPEKPVGTVCFGIALAGQPVVTVTRRFPGDRATIRALATTAALHLLLDQLD